MRITAPVLGIALCSLLAGPLALTAAQAQDAPTQIVTLQCVAKSGEGVQLEGGSLMTHFSGGTNWVLVLDMDNGLANVDLRTDKRGHQTTFTEKYRTTINSEYYVLISVEIKTGAMGNGVYNIHDIEITINRATGQYRRMLRLQDLNSNTGTYKYYSETGECALKPAAPAATGAAKF